MDKQVRLVPSARHTGPQFYRALPGNVGVHAETREVQRWQEAVHIRTKDSWQGLGAAAQWSRSSGKNRTRRGADDRPGLEVRRPDVCPNWLCGFHQIDHLLRTPAPLATHLCKALEFSPSKGGPQNE